MQLLNVVSLVVTVKPNSEMTEFHALVQIDGGEPFRLRTNRGRAPRLMHFGAGSDAKTQQQIEELLKPGSQIFAAIGPVPNVYRSEADGFQVGDMAVDPKSITTAAKKKSQVSFSAAIVPVMENIPGTLLFNDAGKMGVQPVAEHHRRMG